MSVDMAEVLFHYKNIDRLSICKTDDRYELDIVLSDGRAVCAYGATIEEMFKHMKEAIG